MGKRVSGEGYWSIQKKGNREYHRFRVTINGRQRDFYGKTKSEAYNKYKAYLSENHLEVKKEAKSLYQIGCMTVEARKSQLKKTTYDLYRTEVESIGKDKIGKEQIAGITAQDIQTYIDSFMGTKSYSSIKTRRVVLKMIFDYAEDNGYALTNPVRRVKMPNPANVEKETREPVFLTSDERRMLEEEANRVNAKGLGNSSGRLGMPFYGVSAKAIVFILHSGLRVSELVALTWDDVDFKKERIRITKNAPVVRNYEDEGKHYSPEVTTPKRESSFRTVPLDNTAMGVLTELKKDRTSNVVFANEKGNLLSRRNISRTLEKMVNRLGFEKKPSVHDLRHTFASELIRKGADIKTVSEILGHKDIATTLNIYVHKSEGDLDQIKGLLD